MGIIIDDNLVKRKFKPVVMITDNIELTKLIEDLSENLVDQLDETKDVNNDTVLRTKLAANIILEQLKKIIV